jgi:hypothetical protein
MLAEHRYEPRVEVDVRGCVFVPLEVSFDADPVHLASASDVESGALDREN